MCNDLYTTDSLEVFKALCVSKIKLEFWCCSQVQVFETQWCVNNAFCNVSEGQLKFTYQLVTVYPLSKFSCCLFMKIVSNCVSLSM